MDVFLLESFPFLTSFYGKGGTKFPKNSWTAIVLNFVIDRGRGESGKPKWRPQLAMERRRHRYCGRIAESQSQHGQAPLSSVRSFPRDVGSTAENRRKFRS